MVGKLSFVLVEGSPKVSVRVSPMDSIGKPSGYTSVRVGVHPRGQGRG